VQWQFFSFISFYVRALAPIQTTIAPTFFLQLLVWVIFGELFNGEAVLRNAEQTPPEHYSTFAPDFFCSTFLSPPPPSSNTNLKFDLEGRNIVDLYFS